MKKTNIEPDLQYVLNQYSEFIKSNFNCVEVGQIVEFYPNDKTADVKICFKQKFNDEIIDYPLLLKCPVMGNKITLPIEVGEFCIVLFNDRNIDGWWETGDTQLPRTNEKHNLSDGIVITGLNSLINKIDNYDNENINLNYNSKINGTLEVSGETNINNNTNIKGNTDSTTYSTGGVAGISGTFVNAGGQKLIFTNGLITAIE